MFPPPECKNAGHQKKQVNNLKRKVPKVAEIFDVHGVIGEGSYGSVFLASLKTDKSQEKHKLFAIKHLIPISHPERIQHELKCLRTIGGQDNVVGIDLCIRQEDAVIFVMPYLPHIKFSEYYLHMDVAEIKLYIKNLLIALNRVHQFNVIHRDVKPSNFLYDRSNKRFLLVDFGLAQKVYYKSSPIKVTLNKNELSSVPGKNGTIRKRKFTESEARDDEENIRKIKKLYNNQFFGQNNHLVSFAPSMNTSQTTLKPIQKNIKIVTPMPKNHNSKANAVKRVYLDKTCKCSGTPSVCSICLNRQPYKASRSGTPGYRPPEVLLKYPDQTTAVDIWACGVIMLALLSGCYPFFNASDDLTALAEIVTLFGSSHVKRIATILGRDFICSHLKRPINLRKLCAYLRSRNRSTPKGLSNRTDNSGCEMTYPKDNNQPSDTSLNGDLLCNIGDQSVICDHCALPSDECVCLKAKDILPGIKSEKIWAGFPDDAFDLLEKLLDVNPHTRIRASEALNHSFFADL